MKQIYVIILGLLFINLSGAQIDQLRGSWTLDSISDSDIIIENPSVSYIEIVDLLGRINIDSFCGDDYRSLFTSSNTENSFEISQTDWTPLNCPEDSSGWENALYSLFGNNNSVPKEITYQVTNEQGVVQLVLDYSIIVDGISTGSTGYLSRVLPPDELLENWKLHSITIDGVQHDNYIGEIFLEFTTMSTGNQDYFSMEGATPCEGNGGGYRVLSSNSIHISDIGATASCSGDIDALYTTKYRSILSHNDTNIDNFIYEIVDEGPGFQLTLTNTLGDLAVFKTYLPEPSNTLFKTWYSYSTENENGIFYPSSNEPSTLTLSKSEHWDIGFQVQGFGGCNEFSNSYLVYYNNEKELRFTYYFEQSQDDCENNLYESNYFSVLSDEDNATFNYELLDNGETLVLTNTIGDVLTFGSNPPPTELLGEWFLNYVEVDNVIHPNYYNNESFFELEFIESPGSDSFYDFIGIGACDSFGGISIPSQNNITFSEFNFTLSGPCPPTPAVVFENLYFSIFENQSAPFDFQYVINGEDDQQTLSLINPVTGNQLIYGRTPNTETLARTWYLSRIEIPGNPTIEIPNTESPSLTITNDINPNTFRSTAFGEGDCNAFMSDYEITLNNGNSIQMLDFSPTLSFCDSGYEDEYFNILGFSSNNFSEFEILNNGTTLHLTDLLGVKLVFGDEPLSISENDRSTLFIALKNNPVTSEINLVVNSSRVLHYEIYSIDGKLINKAKLNSESITINHLNSGLYFIRFFDDSNQVQTIKFIKQ